MNRTVVTRNPIDLFNRTHCQVVSDSSYRPKVLSTSLSIIEQLNTIADEFTQNCSRINCQIDRLNYTGAICLKTGQTYENLCELLIDLCTKQIDMSQATIDYLGQCVNNCSLVKRCFSDQEICVMTPKVHCVRREKHCTGFSPVCDIEGKMFINRCHLSNSLKFNQPRQMAYRGPCRVNRRCTIDLCSSDELCIETQDKFHLPVCIDCSSNATSNACQFELFCGDNQRQYVTRCQLHNDRCQTKTFIRIDRFGLCAKDEEHFK